MREIDRRSIEQYHIPGIVLMENAARAAADVAMAMLAASQYRSALILCGGGNNGGDGLAVARHLHNRGVKVLIAPMIDVSKWRGDPKINWDIVAAMQLPVTSAKDLQKSILANTPGLILDAIFGTGLTAPPRESLDEWANFCAAGAAPVLAIDLPSGMDSDTGKPLGTCIRATKTVTFVAEKAGFANPASREYTGEIIVGEIGCPRELIAQVLGDLPA